jgi:hypothetical protein
MYLLQFLGNTILLTWECFKPLLSFHKKIALVTVTVAE